MIEPSGLDLQLLSLSTRLARMLTGIEPVFMRVGSQLSTTVDQLGQLNLGFGRMAARVEADDVIQATRTLREISAGITGLADSRAASEKRLNDLHLRAVTLAPRIARLKKTIGEIRVLAINAKVETAHVTARDIDFSVFTREIGRMASLAGAALSRLSDELTGLLASLTGARQDLAGFGRDHHQSLTSVGLQLGRGLAAMAERSQQSANSMRSLADLSRHMADAVAQIVVSLQVGDMTRQRGEHVVEALRTLQEVTAAPDLPADHRRILIASVCRLQAAQASNAGADLAREVAAINRNLDTLARDVATLPERCSTAYGGAGDQRLSFLAELSHDLQAALHLLRAYAQARTGIDALVGEITQVVAGMVRHIEAIHSIEADMRVMGLNATFKCSRLGSEGRGLSVIAQELRSYSNRTAEEGAAIMAELTALTQAAGRMDEDERQSLGAARMETAMEAAVQTLDAVGDDLTRTMATLGSGCSHATQALEQAHRLLNGHPEFAAGLTDAAATLGAAAGPDAPDPGAMDSIRSEVLDMIRTRYTMAAERKVHELLGDKEPAAGTQAVEADDFLF